MFTVTLNFVSLRSQVHNSVLIKNSPLEAIKSYVEQMGDSSWILRSTKGDLEVGEIIGDF